ncbi:unnamed protein product [Clonostachys byssicola]|uniref:Uncharacterized protein n=1 Tax=Clonostachys byssicola TaxID=160290 RepID=A0A9N9XU63_9HYPO|nr:unnamed protein product [Clonostachys byssicola]
MRPESMNSIDFGTITNQYRTYPSRWFGLAVLVLLNIMVSWGWLTFSPLVSQSAEFYHVDESMVNWLSTIFVFANFAMTIVTLKLLSWGLRPAIITGSTLLLLGNWVRYAGSRSYADSNIVAVSVGQALIGLSQSVVLSAPTRYSEVWFTSSGRVSATAIMSLASPAGAAIGQVVSPLWVQDPSGIGSMVLYVSIISSAVAVLGFLVPGAPPTPPAPSGIITSRPVLQSLRIFFSSLECFLILIPFWIFTALFISTSSLLNQILSPYGFSDSEAGIGGALIIVAGLAGSAVAAPLIDRTKKFTAALKLGLALGSACYLALIWVPSTRSIGGLYGLLCVMGITSLAIVAVALEAMTEFSHPLGPEITSTFAWAGGQLIGGCFILAGDAMKAGSDAAVPYNMTSFTIFQAVLAISVVPVIMSLGMFGRGDKMVLKRTQLDIVSE